MVDLLSLTACCWVLSWGVEVFVGMFPWVVIREYAYSRVVFSGGKIFESS